MSQDIIYEISKHLGTEILEVISVTGGDINEAYRISTETDAYFLKYNRSAHHKGIISSEVDGLQALADKHVRVPELLHHFSTEDFSGIMLEWIEVSNRQTSLEGQKDLAIQLSIMHSITNDSFGYNENNYIGSITQSNAWYSNFTDYYLESRLIPQYTLARAKGFLSGTKDVEKTFMKMCQTIPEEKATLLHGDLWSGNYMIDHMDKAYLIDPSASYGHREMDIAMMHLFGGPSEMTMNIYNEILPLRPNWRDRMDVFQLYYLLVHLNIFGSSYESQVLSIINKYS